MESYENVVKELSSGFIQKMLNLKENEFEVIKTNLEFSELYAEIEILFSMKRRIGIFQEQNPLRIFKYDLSNKCGVLTRVNKRGSSEKIILNTIGDKSILMEKGWI